MKETIDSGRDNSRKRTLTLAALLSISGVICILFMAAFVLFQPDQLSLSDRYFPSATASITNTPTSTPTVTLTPTDTLTPTITNTPTISPTPTSTATPHVLITPSEDVTMVEDRFDSNELDWSSYYSGGQVNISEGTMHVRSDQKGSVVLALCQGCPDFENSFYFQAELLPEKGTEIEHGLAFCATGVSDDFYVFAISSKEQYYSLSKLTTQGWKTLIRQTLSSKINRFPKANTLAVQYDKGYVKMYVNGDQISSFIDADPLSCRRIGAYVNDGAVDVLVDNLFVYQSNSSPAATSTP